MNITKTPKILLILLVLFFSLALAGCKEIENEAPSDHTVSKGGKNHAPGLYDPRANCTGCHGSNLEGSGEAPSCTSCHGNKWD
ncbi:MAG: hypothetical protein A2508_05610 [Candidatus Lambdaproteobacteria bacterium RIFOXYD12_FULL_49_8]|uniref:Uncharacterized protein n=1 Tax=Candidatus Lambdaproteobacteria bacterium RIFOXYD2_FULL_50_16 TaxID=1817772 RepID=A0A1F6G7D4_9PROT|nr:MAG: hypothetical protein A2527_09215 [Candidatus Lambdaproteobacteria bacterium RIFOXYD2_FULL_50_16]OGG98396.1 MAG: hypothetical protein A2508_05610 [Candidatus Lambdaproteobacteria bacterium RIFOXYD12_FULL_49_8]